MEERRFLEKVLDDPDADGPRLAYASWLDEQDDPRGSFIRLQCMLEFLPKGDPRRSCLEEREKCLLRENENAWVGPLQEILMAWKFRRGFLEEVHLRADDFLAIGETIYDLEPAPCVKLFHARGCLERLAQSNLLQRVVSLDLSANELDARNIRALATSPFLGQLRSLILDDNGFDAEGAQSLSMSPILAGLKVLRLANNPIGAAGVEALSGSLYLRQLRTLSLNETQQTEATGESLANSTAFGHLAVLEIEGNALGDQGVKMLAESPAFPSMDRLNVGNNFIGDPGARPYPRRHPWCSYGN